MNFSAFPQLAGAQKVTEKEPAKKLSTFEEAAKTTLATDTLKALGTERRSVRIPFTEKKVEIGGGPIVRGALDIGARTEESLATGILRVAGSLSEDIFGKPITLPGGITYEPEVLSNKPRTQEMFGSMSTAAIKRQEQLDTERPEMPFRNTLQAATEEVFLPILDAVDFVGITEIAARTLARKTLTKEAKGALDTLGIGLLEDSSEEGVRRQVQTTIQKNVADLESGKITPEVFVKKQNEVGTAIDVLTGPKNTRFGELGTQINRVATALEAERGGRKAATLAESRVAGSEFERKAKELFSTKTEAPVIKASNPKMQSFVDEKIELFTGKKPVAQAVDDIPEEMRPLVEEARKYKSAEEFVKKAKFEVPIKDILATEGHTPEVMKGKSPAKGYENEPIRVEVNNDGKIQIQDGNKRYYQALERGDKTVKVIFNDQAPELNFQGEFDRLTDIWEKATKSTLPVKEPEAVKKVSKLATRLNETLPDGSKIDEFYDAKVIKEELEKAAKEIEKNPIKALANALDPEKPLSGRAARIMEFAQSAKDRGDVGVQQALMAKMRVLGTEIAQGLNMFKAFGLRNPETDFMESVVKARLNKFAITKDDIKKAGTPSRALTEKVYKPTREEIKGTTGKAFKIEDAQKLLDSLIC